MKTILFKSSTGCVSLPTLKRVQRHQRGNQYSYIEEEQTTQWPNDRIKNTQKYHTDGTVPTSNYEISEKDKINALTHK